MEFSEQNSLLPRHINGSRNYRKFIAVFLLFGGCIGVFALVQWPEPKEINVLEKSNSEFTVPITTVSEGPLLGKVMEARNGREYLAFLGVPYAKAPVGSLRFMPPRDPEPWKGVRNATIFADRCPMLDRLLAEPVVTGNEDCLHVNIYTPNLALARSKSLFPVMLFVHGGGRGYGTGQLFSPEYLLEEDVILITLDYRIGPLGTLNLQIPEASGNQGLKDQTQALKWIQRNIENFGGNPETVTLFGNSGGAFQVSAHMLSPLSKGLFQRAILQSGTAIFPGVLSGEPEKDVMDLALISNCTTNSSVEILSCLKNMPAYTMVSSALSLPSKFSFTFSIDSASTPNDVFLPELPLQLLNNGASSNIPLMIGVTRGEGLLNSLQIFTNPEDAILNSNETNLAQLLSPALYFDLSSSDPVQVAKNVTDFYLNNGITPVTDDLFWNVTDMFSDRQYMHPAQVVVEKQLEVNLKDEKANSPSKYTSTNGVYLYYFTHDVEYSLEQKMKMQVNFSGLATAPAHGDELQFLYPMDSRFPRIRSEENLALSRELIRLWTNFAETGEPGQPTNGETWLPVSGKWPYQAFELNEHFRMIDFLPNRLQFWDGFYLPDLYR